MSIRMDEHYKHLLTTLNLLVAQYGKCQVQEVLNEVDESAARKQISEVADERKRMVAQLRKAGLTLDEIGSLMGVSRERVRTLLLSYEAETKVYQSELMRQEKRRISRISRRKYAYEQRQAGKTYREIGEELGITWQGAKVLSEGYRKTIESNSVEDT